MKKLLAVSIASALFSASAVAGIQTEISQKSANESAFKAGYALDNGLAFSAEYVYAHDKRESKEVTLESTWKFALTDNLWIQPQVALVMPVHRDVVDLSTAEDLTDSYHGNTYKVGLKGGYDFDFGLYTAARYRYEYQKDTVDGVVSKSDATAVAMKFKNQVHRTDLTVGYAIELVNVSMNWVHKEGTTDMSGYMGTADADWRTNDYEFKLAYTEFKTLVPYVQLTVKNQVKGSDTFKATRDNEFKLGVTAAF